MIDEAVSKRNVFVNTYKSSWDHLQSPDDLEASTWHGRIFGHELESARDYMTMGRETAEQVLGARKISRNDLNFPTVRDAILTKFSLTQACTACTAFRRSSSRKPRPRLRRKTSTSQGA